MAGILQILGRREGKWFCLKVFLGCDDHTLHLRSVGRLEPGYHPTWATEDGGMPTPLLHWVESPWVRG